MAPISREVRHDAVMEYFRHVYMGTKYDTGVWAEVWLPSCCQIVSITAPGSQKSAQIATPGPIIDDIQRRIGSNPSDRSIRNRYWSIIRLRKTSMIVVGHTYRVIYITSPSQDLKNLEICPERDPLEPKPCPWATKRAKSQRPKH